MALILAAHGATVVRGKFTVSKPLSGGRPSGPKAEPAPRSPTAGPGAHPTVSRTPGRPWMVLALGDSVPAGSGCACTPFPALYAADIGAVTGEPTVSVNLGRPGLTSGQLLGQLASGGEASTDLAQAAVVTITIGANDFQYRPSQQCPGLSCYAGQLHALARNVAGVLQRVARARPLRATVVRVTGYWEIWEDGKVGAEKGGDYMRVNDALTTAVNTALAQAAAAAAVGYVDLRAAFHRSPSADGDTELLAADGDHPNAAGHRMIADLLRASGLSPVLLLAAPAA
jgi:lysophospholipase L1-like esterase